MIEGSKVLAVIPARGGSKGLPGKNIRMLHNKPLIGWTIDEAKKSSYIDRLICSSDDEGIIQVAKQWGCEVPFVRPKSLAQDETSGIEPVLHAIKECSGYDIIVLLQPTSPLRTVEDIDGCIETLLISKADSCVTVTEASKSPFWMYTVNEKGRMEKLVEGEVSRRQEQPSVYELNGAVYTARIDDLLDRKSFLVNATAAYKMPKERSFDIDTMLDFNICEMILKNTIKEAEG